MGKHDFEFDAHFDKTRVTKLAEELRAWLKKEGVGASIWTLQPWQISIQLVTSRDLSDILVKVYERPEVLHASLSVEPNTRVILLNVFMSERWYLEEEKKNGKAKRHPEAEGGSLA